MTDPKERERFEAWIRDEFFDGCDDAGPWSDTRNCYDRFDVHMAFCGWRAALAQSTPKQKLDALLGDRPDPRVLPEDIQNLP